MAAAAARAAKEATPEVPTLLVAYLDGYVPDKATESAWASIRSTHRDVMARSGVKGEESFKKRSRELAHYLPVRHRHGPHRYRRGSSRVQHPHDQELARAH